MTIFLTILSGFLVFVFGQIFLKLVIEPVQQLKKTIASAGYTLVKFAHIIHNSDNVDQEERLSVFKDLRELSAQIYSATELVPLFSVTRLVFGLPEKKIIYQGSKNIIGISNWIHIQHEHKMGHIIKNIQEVYGNLGLYVSDEDRINEETINALIGKW